MLIALARLLLALVLPADVRGAMLAELDTEYARVIRPTRGSLRAAGWYWRQAIGSIGPALAMRHRRHSRLGIEALHDLRFAARLLSRPKAFSLAVIATLALGIGGTTAMFSLVDGVLLRPLPYRAPDRLVRIW